MKKIRNFLPHSNMGIKNSHSYKTGNFESQENLKMKKMILLTSLILILVIGTANFVLAVSEEDKLCSKDTDCKSTPCGCVNKNQENSCERAILGSSYVISCKCENNKCESAKSMNLSNGRNAEIKIMPETASEKAIERLGELGFNITLKEVGKGENAKVVYEFSGEKQGKMLGLFKVKGKVSAEVDAETGEVIKIKKPWWAFMASGI